MEIRENVLRALRDTIDVHYARLDDDDGITGFVVSPRFQGMSSLDRQKLIDDALRRGSSLLTPEERRYVLMIAAVTPIEYELVGARIRVDDVKALAGGAVEIFLRGGGSDAEYVRSVLGNQKGVRTTEPKQLADVGGTLMSFQAKGIRAAPLTKAKAIRILKSDRYIAVMANN
jgi:hypothetical protein